MLPQAPRHFSEADFTPAVKNGFKFLGQFIGLALLSAETVPVAFNRPVIKWLCGRMPGWHDLAFFNPQRYEFLRQLVANSDSTDWESLCLTFKVGLSELEGSGSAELRPDGDKIAVDGSNVMEFVKEYASFSMIKHIHAPLCCMREGLLQVLPAGYLRGWSAEELQLLLNGRAGHPFFIQHISDPCRAVNADGVCRSERT